MYRDSQTLSSGLADILGVCVRVAIVDSMYQDEKPMLIMDDPFVNLDDRNMAGRRNLWRRYRKNIKYCILHAAKIVYYRYIINTQEEVCCEQ